MFRTWNTEMNPARVEPIDHLGARFGPAFRHALPYEEFRPPVTRNSNRFDGASESSGESSCNIVGEQWGTGTMGCTMGNNGGRPDPPGFLRLRMVVQRGPEV